jgi:Ca2+-binding EF-hand superfamily protein
MVETLQKPNRRNLKMKLTTNSYGFNVPKDEYEELQKEVDKRNEIRMNGLIEFNKILDFIGIETIGLDGYKTIREVAHVNVDGYLPDSRIERLPKPFKNPYDMNFDDMTEKECWDLVKVRIKEFYKIDAQELYDNLAKKMKEGFEEKVKSFAERSINPIRFTLLDKIVDMNIEDFLKIYFRWYNNIIGENVFAPNYVINQWAWYFDIECEREYDCVTDEDLEEMYVSFESEYGYQDEEDYEEDKRIRQYFNDLYN